MKNNPIHDGLNFIKRNPTIIYSLVLIFVVTGIIFFNSYYSLREFEKGTDKLLQSKALLGGNVLKVFGSDLFSDKDLLKKKLEEVAAQDPEIRDIAILEPGVNGDGFSVLVSLGDAESFHRHPSLYAILWSEGHAIASVDHDEKGRFWNVADIIRDKDGNKKGIILFRLSLSGHDGFSEEIIKNVYWVTIVSLVVVLLIVVNHARLFKYELKAAKLEEIDRMKDDFISMASHELKSPLTAIKGYAELLNEGIKEEDYEKKKEHIRYVNNIRISVARLRDLVEDILDVSRLEQNRLPIDLENIDIAEIVRGVSDEMSISADEKKLELVNMIDGSLEVVADRDRTKQILVNLVSNAIKYTPSGKIEIKRKEDAGFVYVTVADTGLGMSAESMKNLFSKFYRIRTDKTSAISGTGLGLWISKEIAVKMGGDLSVESIEGVGSHFTLKLKKPMIKK